MKQPAAAYAPSRQYHRKVRGTAPAVTTIASGVLLSAVLLQTTPAYAGLISSDGVESSAYGASARITVNGKTRGFAPVGSVAGSGAHGYEVTARIAAAMQNVPLTSGFIHPALRASETGIRTHASSGGFGVDAISAEADTRIRSASVTMVLIPPPPVALASAGLPIVPQPFLQLTATNIASSASWGEVFPNHVTVSGSASFGSLTITGSLVGYRTLSFSGNAPSDTVLYDKDGVTITLDKQIVAGLISCSLGCSFTPESITTDAIDISLHNANVGGRRMSGDIILGQSLADPPAPAPEPSGIAVILAGLTSLALLRHRRSHHRACPLRSRS